MFCNCLHLTKRDFPKNTGVLSLMPGVLCPQVLVRCCGSLIQEKNPEKQDFSGFDKTSRRISIIGPGYPELSGLQ